MSVYLIALSQAVGLLTLKIVVTHLLTVRTRMMKVTYKAKEDNSMPGPVVAIFKLLLGAYGPTFESADRLLAVAGNAVENEPFWFAASLMLEYAGKAKDTDVNLIWAYVALRYIHALAYIVGVQPWRALSYTGGLALTLCTATRLLM